MAASGDVGMQIWGTSEMVKSKTIALSSANFFKSLQFLEKMYILNVVFKTFTH